MNGIVFIDKDEGLTSHDVVSKLRRVLAIKRIGHAGTLDPMATGLLTLGVGPSTRLLTYMVGLPKTYETTIRLGESTVTDDREGETTETAPEHAVAAISESQILAQIQKLTGEIQQIPSKVSAIKVQGRRAYDLVREGEEVKLKPRTITVHSFDVKAIHKNGSTIDVEAVIDCSSGTYIRALARDLGAALGIGGHLTALRRTKVGPFTVAEAQKIFTEPEIKITPAATVAKKLFTVINLDAQQSVELLQGKRFTVDHQDAELLAALSPEEKLLGLISVKNGLIKAITNFPQQ